MIPRVHAVVLNYNQYEATLRAVRELADSRDVDTDVLVVDCASAPGDRAALEHAVSTERLLLLSENRGYAGGMNAGIRFWLERAPDTPVLLVTPDARVGGDVARVLCDALLDAGVVGPVVTYDEPRGRIGAGGTVDHRGRVRLLTVVQGSAPYDVDWLDGCCLLLNPRAIHDVGGFDEEYFLYYEETDLCQRMRKRGWPVRLIPSVSVLHPKSHASTPPHFFYYMARNGYRFRARHFGVGTLRAALDLARAGLWLTAVACASLVLPARWSEARDRWRNCWWLWRGAWLGTRDHLNGRYGAGQAPTQHPA